MPRRGAVLLGACLAAVLAAAPAAPQDPSADGVPTYYWPHRVFSIPVDVARINRQEQRPTHLQLYYAVGRKQWQRGEKLPLDGLKDIGEPKEGETLVVSAASGAVGQVVGQLGRIAGCRVIGIAGGVAKCAFVREELGFDAALDHRGDLDAQLDAACPDGIDIYWENVGGALQEAVFPRFRDFGRQVIKDADGEKIPAQDLYFVELANGYSYAVRGSGTEPKIKFYIFARGKVKTAKELPAVKETTRAALDAARKAIETDAAARAES